MYNNVVKAFLVIEAFAAIRAVQWYATNVDNRK